MRVLPSRWSGRRTVWPCGFVVLLAGCMGEGECPVYDYDPDAVRVSFRDAATGEPLCDVPNAAKPGVLIPIEGACAYYLAGWYVLVDGGVSTTVQLTVKGYSPVSVTFEAGQGACGEPLPPSPVTVDVTADPDAED